MADEKKEMEFEAALKKLETIVANLENGELSLEAALKQYEEGVKLADACSKRLSEAEKRVELLMKTTGGKLKVQAFEPEPAREPQTREAPQPREGREFRQQGGRDGRGGGGRGPREGSHRRKRR